jgi:hypothetical protein
MPITGVHRKIIWSCPKRSLDYALGRSPYYPQAAARAVQAYKGSIPKEDFEEFVWQQFLREIEASSEGQGANVRNNPLAPSFHGLKSITSFVAGLGQWSHNLVVWTEEGLREGRIGHTYDELQQVRGVGPKIISLFLRDVVTAFEMNEFDLEPERYLQPIDRWTQRGAEVLASQMQKPKPKTGTECAEIIVEASRVVGVRPSLVNAGLWIFGALFAQTEAKFREVLTTPETLCQLLTDQSRAYVGRARFLDELPRNDR